MGKMARGVWWIGAALWCGAVAMGADAPAEPTEAQRKEIAALIAQLPGEDMGSRMQAMQAHEKLVAIGRPAVPQLIEALGHKDTYCRVWASAALGSIGDPRGKEAMIPLLKDKAPVVRQITVWHIHRWLDDPRIEEATIDLMHDPVPDVSKWAQRAMEDHDRKVVTRELRRKLKSPDAAVRETALYDLEQRLSEKQYGEILLDRLANDPSGPIRGKALKALLPRDDLYDRVVPILVGWLEDTPADWPPEEVARSHKIARLALKKLTGDPFGDRTDIPADESAADAARRWRQWLNSKESPPAP